MRVFPFRLRESSKESQKVEQQAKIIAVHRAMTSETGVVGRLARLYERLAQSALGNNSLQATHAYQYDRRSTLYIGGITFDGLVGEETQVKGELRRYTTIHTTGELKYAEIGIFVSNQEASLVRGCLHTNRNGWAIEGTASPGGSAYTSVKTPRFSYPKGFHILIDDFERLAATVCPEAVMRELPPTPPTLTTQQ